MKKLYTLMIMLAMVMTLVGCSTNSASTTETQNTLASTGVLTLRVNPEIAISYDENGKVIDVKGVNDDGKAIASDTSSYVGKETRAVVAELLTKIGEAGYLVEEVEGEKRQVIIEIEEGSVIPYTSFVDDVVSEVKVTIDTHKWQNQIDLRNETDYGITSYVDTDYGPDSDGFTDYDDTDYGPNNDGVTDYDNTDYGPNNDGVTDYDNTDYGPNNDGVTDYDDTDYGPNNDGVTDYSYTNYGTSNYSSSDYSNSNYGDSAYDD